MDDIYKEIILDHYKNPRNFGKISQASAYYQVYNAFCGDLIEMYLVIDKQKIKKIRFFGKGCVIAIVSASMLTEHVFGKKTDEINKLGKEDILKMLNIKLTPIRLKCALLSLEVLQSAIDLIK